MHEVSVSFRAEPVESVNSLKLYAFTCIPKRGAREPKKSLYHVNHTYVMQGRSRALAEFRVACGISCLPFQHCD